VESVRPLVRANVAALDSFRRQAEARSEQAMQSYVQQQLEYGEWCSCCQGLVTGTPCC
jgi:hypothetical protein